MSRIKSFACLLFNSSQNPFFINVQQQIYQRNSYADAELNFLPAKTSYFEALGKANAVV